MTAMATVARVMATVRRVAGERQQQGQRWQQQLWWAKMRAMGTAMRVAINKEGKGSKTMAAVTRMAGEQ
jgi:hypothetical protein